MMARGQLGELHWDDRFLAELPVDPDATNRSRQVRGAVASLVQPTAGVQGAKRDSARRASTAESEHRPPPSGRWLVLGIPSERVFAEACLAAALPALPEILAQLAS